MASVYKRKNEDGLSPEETALYDALAHSKSALDVMGNEQLRIIAAELVTAIRDNSGVDWWRQDAKRKKIRVTVKRILKKYGFPPDLQDEAIKEVVEQAEALAAEVSAKSFLT